MIFVVAKLGNRVPGYRVIECPTDEEPATNLIRFCGKVLCAAGFSQSKALMIAEGYKVAVLLMAETAKVDGALSCMSLRCSI